MDEKSVVGLLREVKFLDGIAEEDLQQLANEGKVQELKQGEILFHEGEPALDFYCVVRGEMSLEISSLDMGNRRIKRIGSGEILGWASLLQLGRLTATARATAPTLAVVIPSRTILALSEARPQFGFDFMRRTAHTLARRLDATRQHFLQVSGMDLPLAEEEST